MSPQSAIREKSRGCCVRFHRGEEKEDREGQKKKKEKRTTVEQLDEALLRLDGKLGSDPDLLLIHRI